MRTLAAAQDAHRFHTIPHPNMRTLWALVALAPLALAARSCTPRDVGSMDDWAPADFECAAAVSADALWTGGKDNLTALLAATDKWVADHLAHVPGDDYPRIRESLSSALAFLTAMADVLGGCASPQSSDRAQVVRRILPALAIACGRALH